MPIDPGSTKAPTGRIGRELRDIPRQIPGLAVEQVLQIQNEVLELVARNAPLGTTLSAIARFAERCIPGMMASILYFDPLRGCLARGGYGSLPDSFAEIVDGLVPGPRMGSCGTCAYTQQRIISEDVETDPLWADFLPLCRTYGIRSAWSSPLLGGHDGSLLGVFGMYHPQVRLPSAADLEIVDHFTHLASIAAERHRFDGELRQTALLDAVTGLGNRHQLEASGPALVHAAQESGSPLCLAFLDLDRFKSFNDVFGHVQGDRLLQAIGACLRSTLKSSELLVRFGGDEFVIFLSESIDGALNRLAALRSALATELQLDGASVRVGFSGGVVDCGTVQGDLQALIFSADEAARRAKALGGDRDVVANPEHSARSQLRRRLELDIADAFEQGQLDPHLQPIVRLANGAPIAVELLYRLRSERFATLPAAEQIEIAEESGLIHRVGTAMMRDACALLGSPSPGLEGLAIHVNVSVHQLLRREFVDACATALQEHAVDPGRIYLEITETRWLDSAGPARDALLALKQMGFRLALDDFGTGYASLTYLQSLPLDVIKVDRSFTQQAQHSQRGRALCAALLAMGQACSMDVIAEGVETTEQVEVLMDMGYQLAQGFLWSPPMPRTTALEWLARRRSESGKPG